MYCFKISLHNSPGQYTPGHQARPSLLVAPRPLTQVFSGLGGDEQQLQEDRCAGRGEGAKRKVWEVWETWCNLGVVWRPILTPPPAPPGPSPPLPRQSLLLDPSLKLLSFAGPSLLQGGGVGGEEEG